MNNNYTRLRNCDTHPLPYFTGHGKSLNKSLLGHVTFNKSIRKFAIWESLTNNMALGLVTQNYLASCYSSQLERLRMEHASNCTDVITLLLVIQMLVLANIFLSQRNFSLYKIKCLQNKSCNVQCKTPMRKKKNHANFYWTFALELIIISAWLVVWHWQKAQWDGHNTGQANKAPPPTPNPVPGKPDTPGNAVTYFSCQHHMDDSSYIMHIFRLLLSPVHHLSAVHHSKQFINFVTENWTFWCLAAASGEMVL